MENIRAGKHGEAVVANLFRRAGYKVVRSPKSRGVFDMVAERAGVVFMVQVKLRADLSAALSRPFKMHGVYWRAPAPLGARKIHWGYWKPGKKHFIYEVTESGFTQLDLPAVL